MGGDLKIPVMYKTEENKPKTAAHNSWSYKALISSSYFTIKTRCFFLVDMHYLSVFN